MCGCFSHTPYWGPGPQPRHVPDWKSNQRPFGLQGGAQSTAPHQPGWMETFWVVGTGSSRWPNLSNVLQWFPLLVALMGTDAPPCPNPRLPQHCLPGTLLDYISQAPLHFSLASVICVEVMCATPNTTTLPSLVLTLGPHLTVAWRGFHRLGARRSRGQRAPGSPSTGHRAQSPSLPHCHHLLLNCAKPLKYWGAYYSNYSTFITASPAHSRASSLPIRSAQ